MRRLALFGAVAVMAATAPAAEAIIGGQADGVRHPYVGYVRSSEGFCSGSLVSSTVFVTAAHCAPDGERVGVTVAERIFSNTPLIPGTLHQLPGFCRDCGGGLPGFAVPDLAVVKLDVPIIVSRYASLPSVGLSDAYRKQLVGDVGYGVNDYVRGGGQPQEVVNFERSFASLRLSPAEDRISDRYVKLSANNPKGAFCFGDSGGPVLAGDTLLAINSILNGRCTSSSYAYRIDTAQSLAFIRQFL
jgi:hypothetical protein